MATERVGAAEEGRRRLEQRRVDRHEHIAAELVGELAEDGLGVHPAVDHEVGGERFEEGEPLVGGDLARGAEETLLGERVAEERARAVECEVHGGDVAEEQGEDDRADDDHEAAEELRRGGGATGGRAAGGGGGDGGSGAARRR